MRTDIVSSLGVPVFIFIFLCSVINAIEIDEVLENIQKKENGISDLKVKIIQRIEFKEVDEKHTIRSEVTFKKPDKILLIQQDPESKTIVSDGKKLFIYSPLTKQVFVETWKNWKGISYIIPGIFNPEGRIQDLKKNYVFELLNEEKDAYVILLKPKRTKKIVLRTKKHLPERFEFNMWISREDFLPVKSKFISQTVVCITELTDWQVNLEPPDELFRFKIPADVEVLRLE
ncbi:MAG: hypothetical protein COY53_01365 [Elusimicrobia bacterium CG_4_10_14_0_8_um_filter_37_32]|nr:MAG: hypothetical protein COS17_09345 [Elusimicrobia bacterium CG02_land_8_20_14_3_00_37_13]PIZ14100.1 MAG: hypothetical protein COY53_01365 [Elusimicrobia bacterium CG_4_10_14_0_8_um_filter_37_32]